jgi:hypothetical protein
MLLGVRTYLKLAADQGLEPQYSPPEGDVLPLDESAIRVENTRNMAFFQFCYT